MRSILRPSRDAVTPVVAEILLVAIVVVLAAVLYLMATGLLGSNPTPAPVVALAGPEPYPAGSDNTTFTVADASRAETIQQYKFSLAVGSTLSQSPMNFGASRAAVPITVGATVYQVMWTNLGGSGALSQGDRITITGNGVSLPTKTIFDFYLVWSDGSVLAHEAWTTP